MKRTALHHYQRHTMSDANIMRGLAEDKKFYDEHGMDEDERRARQDLMANVVNIEETAQ